MACASTAPVPVSTAAITIKVLPASQFVIKTVAALDLLKVSYTLQAVDTQKLREQVPPPHTVPSGRLPTGELLSESNDIIRHFDTEGTLFRGEANELEQHFASTFNAYVLYYNWIHQPTFDASIKVAAKRGILLARVMPFLIGPLVGKTRDRIRAKVKTILKLDDAALANEAAVRDGLHAELAAIEERAKAHPGGFLTGPQPSVADFMLYGAMMHLVEDFAGLPPALPNILATYTATSAWFKTMRERFPVASLLKDSPAYVPLVPEPKAAAGAASGSPKATGSPSASQEASAHAAAKGEEAPAAAPAHAPAAATAAAAASHEETKVEVKTEEAVKVEVKEVKADEAAPQADEPAATAAAAETKAEE